MLEVSTQSAPTLRRGDNPAAALDRLRADIDTTTRELMTLQFAAPTRAEIEAKVHAYVASCRRAGSPIIVASHERFAVNWFGSSPGLPQPTIGPPQVAAMLAWYDPDAFTARLIATLADMPTTGEGISAADRTTRTAELTAQIEQLEHREEFLIQDAARHGHELLRRPHANPMAILGIRIASTREAVAA